MNSGSVGKPYKRLSGQGWDRASDPNVLVSPGREADSRRQRIMPSRLTVPLCRIYARDRTAIVSNRLSVESMSAGWTVHQTSALP